MTFDLDRAMADAGMCYLIVKDPMQYPIVSGDKYEARIICTDRMCEDGMSIVVLYSIEECEYSINISPENNDTKWELENLPLETDMWFIKFRNGGA